MISRILVPLDRSPLAEQAIGKAITIAQGCKAQLEVVLVHERTSLPSPLPWFDRGWDTDRQYVETVAAEITRGAGVVASGCLLTGGAAEMICQRSHETAADLIVMTSHGRTGFSRAWMGSVADAVVRESSVPVLMLRPTEAPIARARPSAPFTHVLVPLDGSALSAAALPSALDVARATGARVTALRVIPPVPVVVTYDATAPLPYAPLAVDDVATQRLIDDAKKELAELAAEVQSKEGITLASAVVVDNLVANAIVDFATTHLVDVVAMSTHGRGASRYLIGSIADKVLRGSALPVLMHRPVGVRPGMRLMSDTSVMQQLPALSGR